MIVQVIDHEAHFSVVPGPPDLAKYGNGYMLCITGDISEMDKSTWGFAIGMFVMRGGEA